MPELKRKPLGQRAYGSIGHLPQSRLGPGDHRINDGQARILLSKPRDSADLIIVQEKLDGSNVAAAKIDGQIVPLVRAGYVAWSSPYEQHTLWARWVQDNAERFNAVLDEGERLCGEWLAQAHGTRYDLPHEPFVVFDLMKKHRRLAYGKMIHRVVKGMFVTPNLLFRDHGTACSIDLAMANLGPYGRHGAIDPVEGAVWRVERDGEVDFLAKYVRPDKRDGTYLPEVSSKPAVWNWSPSHA